MLDKNRLKQMCRRKSKNVDRAILISLIFICSIFLGQKTSSIVQEMAYYDESTLNLTDPKTNYPSSLPTPDFLDFNVTEFNDTSVINENDPYGIIYQAGEFETAAFYSVSGNTILNASTHHTTGFNFSLPAPYYEYWDLSYVSYFNMTPVVKEENTQYFVPGETGEEEVNISASLTEAIGDVQIITSKYSNISAIGLEFSNVVLNEGDILNIYNETYDEDLLLEQFNSTNLPSGIIQIGAPTAVVELISANASTSSYLIDTIHYEGTKFERVAENNNALPYRYGELIEFDPDVIGANITLTQLSLTTGSTFFISDPTGENVTKIVEGVNYTTYFDGSGFAKTSDGEWGPEEWIRSLGSGYCIYAIDAAGDISLNNFTVGKIELLTPQGWQRVYSEEQEKIDEFLTYTDNEQTVQVEFQNIFDLLPDDSGYYYAYSSWTFVWNKRPFDMGMEVFEYDQDGNKTLMEEEDLIFHEDTAYNFQINVTERDTGSPIENFNLPQQGYQEIGLEGVQLDDMTPYPLSYNFSISVNIDGTGVREFVFLVPGQIPFSEVIALMNAEIHGFGADFVVFKGDIRCISQTTGNTSSIEFSPGNSGESPWDSYFLFQTYGAEFGIYDDSVTGEDLVHNDVSIQLWQDGKILVSNITDIYEGSVNFTLEENWGEDNGIHAGEFRAIINVGNTNYWAFDNASARKSFIFYYYETPSIRLNNIHSEYLGVVDSDFNVTTTAGTLYDPNMMYINVSALDMYGMDGPMNGQPFHVVVRHEEVIQYETVVYQILNGEDFGNYTEFYYSYNETGEWTTTFTLKNTTLEKPLGYYLPIEPLVVNITVIPRIFELDIYNGSAGIVPGEVAELYVNVTDYEEIDVYGDHYPISNWEVNYYYLQWHDNQLVKYYIGQSFTNTTGIAKLNWLPPNELAGTEIYILAHIKTAEEHYNQYITDAYLMKKGFELLKLDTILRGIPSQEVYYFDEPLVLDTSLYDAVGQSLFGETIHLGLKLVDRTSGSEVISYIEKDLVIGENNTHVELDYTPFIGDIFFNLTYSETGSYYAAALYEGNVSVIKAETEAFALVDTYGFNFTSEDSLPIDVSIVEYRNMAPFNDTGTMFLRIFDKNNTEIYTKSNVTDFGSAFFYTDWNVNLSGMYSLNLTYSGGLYHEPANFSTLILVDRNPFDLVLTVPDIIAGEGLLLEADVHYRVNQTAVANKSVVFEFTDRMGNVYILGYNTTDADGYTSFTYPYDPKDYIYLYMVEFGGQVAATSQMTLNHNSGSDFIYDFQIPKCPVEVSIHMTDTVVAPQEEVMISFALIVPDESSLSTFGEILYIEIWSDQSSYQNEYAITITEVENVITFTPSEVGNYFIKALYKGSHIIEANAHFLTFECTRDGEVLNSLNIGSGLSPSGTEDPIMRFYMLIMILLLPVGFSSNFTGKENKVKMKASMLIGMMLVGNCYYLFYTIESTPSTESFLGEMSMGAESMFQWLENQDLPKEDLDKYMEMMGVDVALMEQNSIDQLNALVANPDVDQLMDGLGVSEPASAADDEHVNDVSLGSYGTVPYPIGDTLNISFTTVQDSYFMIIITDLNLQKRMKSLYGLSGVNERQQIYIPITKEEFDVGGKYALELYVYEVGVTNYWKRDMRRMTFNVIRGFTAMDIFLPNIDVYENRYCSITLKEDLSGNAMAYQQVSILVFDEDLQDYKFYTRATSDENGKISILLPENSLQGQIPLQIVYQGDQWHYGTGVTPNYVINPIDTYLSLSAAPVHYTDEGTISATLTDELGNKLSDKQLSFILHVENKTIGDYDLVTVGDQWQNLGNITTNEEGVAEMNFPCIYPEGTYEIGVAFEGDEIYNESYSSGYLLEVLKEELTIDFIERELTYGLKGILSINLTDNDGEPSAFTPVTFSAYYQHEWHTLGATNSTGSGHAAITSCVYWDEGTYILRVVKEEDDRFANSLVYGELIVDRTNASIDIAINSTEYRDEMHLSARLSFLNGTNIEPVTGETLLFYVYNDHMPNNGMPEFMYVGNGITDENGMAAIVWIADFIPDVYTLKVFFPGNSYIDPFDVCEHGLEVLKKTAKIQITAPSRTPVMDYADFTYNITDPFTNDSIAGETLRVTVYNYTNPDDILITRDVITDGYGFAYFRWCPGSPGEYTVHSELISDYYAPSVIKTRITVTRKSVNFNTTLSETRYFRGDVSEVSGNAMMIYKHYNGTTEIIPAINVPLMFHIWNETNFMHPVSGFLVPNVPIKHFDRTTWPYTEYTSGGSETAGDFSWKWILPDEAFGLQAGQYMIRIKVDETKTGLYAGEGYFSFDLVEPTSLDIWIDKSSYVSEAQDSGRIPSDHDYFVNETERVEIQHIEQDAQGLKVWDHDDIIHRDLLINIGSEKTLYFHVDEYNTPTIYEGFGVSAFANLTDELQPMYIHATGQYSFDYVPYYSGVVDISVSYAGDRYYSPTSANMQRIVYRRPTYFTTEVSHTTDLYRASTTLDWVQKETQLTTFLQDVIWLTPVQEKELEYYFDYRLMSSRRGFSINPTETSLEGITDFAWHIDDLVQHGVHDFYFLSPQTRIYVRNESVHSSLEIWETTRSAVSIANSQNMKVASIKFYDQDDDLIKDAEFSVSFSGDITSGEFGGPGRGAYVGLAAGGIAEVGWDPAENKLSKGDYKVIVDYLTNFDQKLRGSTFYGVGPINTPYSGGTEDILYHDTSLHGSVAASPYAAWSTQDTSKVYYNLQEARRKYSISDYDFFVNTYDGFSGVAAKSAYYVWIKNFQNLQYTPVFCAKQPALIAFGYRENADAYIQDFLEFGARIVEWNFVFPEVPNVVKAHYPFGSPYAATGVPLYNMPAVHVKGTNDILPDYISDSMDTTIGNFTPMTASGGSDGGSSSGDKASGFFGEIADILDDYDIKYLYQLPFRILEIVIQGGKKIIPQAESQRWVKTTSPIDGATISFEVGAVTDLFIDGTIEVSGDDLDSDLNTNNVADGENSLKMGLEIGGDTVIPGDFVKFGIDQTDFSGATEFQFSLYADGNVNNGLHANGINISLIDTNGYMSTQQLRSIGTGVYDKFNFGVVSGNMINFEKEDHRFNISSVEGVQFTVVPNGFLTKKDNIYVDKIEFLKAAIIRQKFTPPPEVVNIDVGKVILQEILINMIILPIYETLDYALNEAMGAGMSSFMSLEEFYTLIANSVLAGLGGKSIFDIFFDILQIFISGFQNMESKINEDPFGSAAEWTSQVASGDVALFKDPKFYMFIVAGSLAGIARMIPGYVMELDEVWELTFDDGMNPITIVKKGFKRVGRKDELAITMVGLFIAIIKWVVVKFTSGKVRTVITKVLDAVMGIAQTIFSTRIKPVTSSGGSGSPASNTKFSLKDLISDALGVSVVMILIDLIIDICLSLISVPWWLKWMLDVLIRILAKIVAFIYLMPAELSTIPLKVGIVTVLSLLVSEFIAPPLLKLCGSVTDDLLHPFRSSPSKMWDGAAWAK